MNRDLRDHRRLRIRQSNRLTGIDLAYTSGTPVPNISYAYDAASRRTSMTDATGTSSYTYDDANRLLTVAAPVTGTVTYTYHSLGRRPSLLYPGQSTPVTYAYTTRGQLDTVTDWLSNVTDYGYDAAGRPTSIDYPNGVDGTLDYDNADRLTGIDYVNGGTTLEAIDYTLNAAGIRTAMTDSSGTTTWGYDALYRLTSADYPSGDDVGYTYDAVGNRETLTVGTVVSDSTYNTLNQLTAIDETDDGTDDITYGYDDNGNLTARTQSSTTTNYGWDSLNRLTSVTSGGIAVASYTYNGDGLRTSKTVGATTTDFTWDPTGLGTVIHVDDGTSDDDYLWGLGLIGRIDGSGAETYAHADGLGSVRAISDNTGVEAGATEYDAFGATRATTGVSYAFGFTGEHIDAETGFVYLRARYMDPEQGRFASRDPFRGLLEQPASQHPYGYVKNSPLVYTDHTGMYWGEGLVDSAVDAATDVLDAVATDENIVKLDVAAMTLTGIAAFGTDVSTLVGCVSGGPVGCAAGYAGGNAATQPLGWMADVLGVTSAFLGCYAHGLDEGCLFNANAAFYGTTIQEPNLDFFIDLMVVVRGLQSAPEECPQ